VVDDVASTGMAAAVAAAAAAVSVFAAAPGRHSATPADDGHMEASCHPRNADGERNSVCCVVLCCDVLCLYCVCVVLLLVF